MRNPLTRLLTLCRLCRLLVALCRWAPPAGVAGYEVALRPGVAIVLVRLVGNGYSLTLPLLPDFPARWVPRLLDNHAAALLDNGPAAATHSGLDRAGAEFEAAMARINRN